MAMSARIILLLTVLMLGCEERIGDFDASSSPPALVVEGVLTNERLRHKISLTLLHSAQNEQATPATGADVTLSAAGVTVQLVEVPAGSGEYYTPFLRAVSGVTYTLSVNYRNKTFTASDASVPVEPLQPLRYHSTGNLFELSQIANGNDPSYTDHHISWENTPSCNGSESCQGRVVMYDLQTIDANEIFKAEAARFRFPVNTIVIRKKYSASRSYRTFLRAMLSETKWRGGLFDVQRANVPTNVQGGGIGFFAVSAVLSDTTQITR
jgi:hypothetical protein